MPPPPNGWPPVTKEDGVTPFHDGESDIHFSGDDASNAFGNNPGASLQTSHNWVVGTDMAPAAGASAPLDNRFYSNYGTSLDKITCSRCHLPHEDTDNPKLLAMGPGSVDAMCLDCHRAWNQSNNHGWLTHPLVADYNAVVAANPEKYKASLINKDNSGLQKVNGGISCTTCHAVHFVDSDASTPDSPYNVAELQPSTGHLLRSDGPGASDKSSLCQSCHTYLEHGDDTGEKIGCLVCHSGHSYDPSAPNYYVLRKTVNTVTYNSATGLDYSSPSVLNNSVTYMFWSDQSDGSADGYCERCHGDVASLPWSNVHTSSAVCTDCHNHNPGNAGTFGHGGPCEECHGHDPGYEYSLGEFSLGAGSVQSHSTHTENDADDRKGPNIGCDGCHDTNDYDYFADGKTLADTIVCDNCHSKNGSYDGVYNAVIGAKANWNSGVYNGAQLQAGKEKWCVTCHDDAPANSQPNGSGVGAGDVIGDNSSYGFYISGHGVNGNIDCSACHDTRKRHIDHIYSPVENVIILGNNPTGYRFYDGAGIKMPGTTYTPTNFALCYKCHDETLISTNLAIGATTGTNFREQDGAWGTVVNLHRFHVIDDLTTNCLQCHNVHGSQRTRMTDPSPEGNGDFRPLRFDGARYYELTDTNLMNDPAHNVGGSIVTNPTCGGCHGAVSLGPGLTLPNDEGWYLRQYDPKSYQDDTDFDGDGVAQTIDNCPDVANSAQTDTDGDGVGDACDNCQVADPAKSFNPSQADGDQDGIGDSCDAVCYGLVFGWGTQFGPGDNEATDVAADSEGNSFVIGNTYAVIEPGYVSQGHPDAFIARYDVQGSRVWIRQFGSSGSEEPNGVAIDANNNIYVVGRTSGTLIDPINSSGNDPFIVKYNADGILKWKRQLHGLYNGEAHDVTVDGDGNVYVTGHTGGDLDGAGSQNHYGGDDIFVASYNSAGVQRWFKQLGTNANDYGYGIAATSSGTIFVAGNTNGDLAGPGSHLGNTDYFIVSFSAADGTQGLLSQHGTTNYEGINALAVSNAGDIFVAGQDYPAGLTTDIFLTKLNASRNIVWKKSFGSTNNDYSRAVAVDNTGNSFIGGKYGSEIILRQYDSNGSLLYNNRWGRGNNDLGGIALDGLERVYLAGVTSGALFRTPASGKDALLFQLDQALCSEGDANDVDNDGVSNDWDNCPYIPNAGQEDNDNDDIGNACDPCPDDSLNDQDGDGVCDSADLCPNDPINDPDGDGVCAVIDNCPYDSNSNQLDSDSDSWGDACDNCPGIANSTQIDTDQDGIGDSCDTCRYYPGTVNDDIATGDGDGICNNVDNCPNHNNPGQENYDLDALGDACDTACTDYTMTWKAQFGTSSDEIVQAVATVGNDGTVVAGFTKGNIDGANAGGQDIFLSRFDSAGTRLWSRQIGSSGSLESANAVAVDAAGNIYVAGETNGLIGLSQAGGKDGFLAKYNSAGGLSWLHQFGTATDDIVTGIAIDASGFVYLTGETRGDLDGAGPEVHYGNKDVFLVQYNSAGGLNWLRQRGTTSEESASDIAIFNNSVYLSGNGRVSGLDGQSYYGLYDAILLKYDTDGNHQWTRQIGTGSDDKAAAVSTDSSGNIYLGGVTLGNLFAARAGGEDFFLAKYDPAGTQLWGRQLGGLSSDSLRDIVAASGGVFVTGITFGDFDNEGPLENQGYSSGADIVLVRIDQFGEHMWSNQFGTSETLWTKQQQSQAIAAAPDGTLYVGGYTSGFFASNNIGQADGILMQIEGCAGPAVPDLSWTGESNYSNDGVDPDSGFMFTDLTFRVKYTDADNDPPPSCEVWIDTDDSSTYTVNEVFMMDEVDAGDVDYTDGKLYSYNTALLRVGDGILNYRFYASDGATSATGDPTINNTVEILNSVPVSPVISSPTDAATDVIQLVTLEASVFDDPNVGDTHQSSQWLISSASGAGFDSNLVYDSGVTVPTTQHTVANTLALGTTYYWKVRYQDNHGGWSNYSSESSFTTINNKIPDQPSNQTPAPGTRDVGLQPTLTASPYSVAEDDPQQASMWQISLADGARFETAIAYSSGVAGTGNSHTVTIPLTGNNQYYWRVRYQDSAGQWSAWSSPTDFYVTTSLVSRYHFDEGVNSTAYDSYGSNNGTIAIGSGASWTTSGFSDQALDFDGVNGNVTWAYAGGTPVNNFTIEAMVKATTIHEIDTEATTGTVGISGQNYLFGANFVAATDAGVGISIGTNGLSVYEHSASYMPPVAVYDPAAKNPAQSQLGTGWNHIVVTYTNKQPRVYLNGHLVHTGLTSPRTNVYAPTELAHGSYGAFAGTIDEVSIYNSALMATEVLKRCIALGQCSDGDMDSDGVTDSADNCPLEPNADQADFDADGRGDVCEYLGYWKFDEGTGFIAQDNTIYDNDGQLIGGTSWTTGKVGNAINLDGISGYVNIPDTPTHHFGTGSFTIETWINASSFTSTDDPNIVRWFSKSAWCPTWSTDPSCVWFVGQIRNTGQPQFSGRGDGDAAGFGITAPGSISLNTWHHLAYVIDRDSTPAKGYIYIDGVNQSGTGVEFPQLNGTLNIPAVIALGGPHADVTGKLDQTAIYDSALSAAEILDHYQNP